MEKTVLIICLVIIVVGLGLGISISIHKQQKPLLVNLQVTEYQNPEALAKVIAEMEARNIKPATIFVGDDLVANHCDLIRELDQKGYEIAAFGYDLDEKGEFKQLANLSKEEQEKIIQSTKETIENCLGHKINGFRSQRFSFNNDTNEIIKNLGFQWHGSFVTGWHKEASSTPYYDSNLGFYVVSMEGVSGTNYVLCDTAMSSSNKKPEEWGKTIENYFLRHQKENKPLITEFHPYFLTANSDWWNEFINLLDWLEKENAKYVTTQQLISSSCLVCGE